MTEEKAKKVKDYFQISAPILQKEQWQHICKLAGLGSLEAITKIIKELHGHNINLSDFSMLPSVELQKIKDSVEHIKTHQTKQENRTIAVIRSMEKMLIAPSYQIIYEIAKEIGADKADSIIQKTRGSEQPKDKEGTPSEDVQRRLVDAAHENEALRMKLKETYANLLELHKSLKWVTDNAEETFFNGRQQIVIKGSPANISNIKSSMSRISLEDPLKEG